MICFILNFALNKQVFYNYVHVLGARRLCHSVIAFHHFQNFLCYGTKYYL